MATEVAEAQPSTSAAADKPDTKEVQDAFNLLAQGKRNMLCGEVPKAVQQLEEACRLLAEKYGEVADQCGDAYLAYGSALLDLSRMESGVLGNALKGIESESEEESVASDDKVEDPEKVSEKEKEEIGDKVIDAMLETDEEQKARLDKEKKPEEKKDETEAKKDDAKDKVDDGKEKSEDKKEDGDSKKEDGDSKVKDDEKTKISEDKKDSEASKEKQEEKMDVDADKEKTGDKEKDEKKTESKEEKDGEKSEAMETEEKKEDEEGEGEAEGEEGEDDEESEALETEEEKEEAEGAAEGEGEKKADTSQEDVSNLQLAWEMLELAKVIYSRHEEKDMKLKAAEAHLKLGEVGLETEQYETAIDDFKSCLKIQQNFLEAESRLIAETHYQIGLACTLACRYTEALDNYRLAVKTIECKIAKLKAQIEESEKSGKHKEAGSFDENVIIAEKEIKDLSEILPDIRAKIEDTEDEMKSQDKVKELVKESVAADMGTSTGFGEASTASPKKAASEPAKDISHMIRKKRKPEDEPEEDEAAKKARQDDDKKEPVDKKAGGDGPATNGTSEHVNGTNGVSPQKAEEIKTKTVEDVKKAAEAAST